MNGTKMDFKGIEEVASLVACLDKSKVAEESVTFLQHDDEEPVCHIKGKVYNTEDIEIEFTVELDQPGMVSMTCRVDWTAGHAPAALLRWALASIKDACDALVDEGEVAAVVESTVESTVESSR